MELDRDFEDYVPEEGIFRAQEWEFGKSMWQMSGELKRKVRRANEDVAYERRRRQRILSERRQVKLNEPCIVWKKLRESPFTCGLHKCTKIVDKQLYGRGTYHCSKEHHHLDLEIYKAKERLLLLERRGMGNDVAMKDQPLYGMALEKMEKLLHKADVTCGTTIDPHCFRTRSQITRGRSLVRVRGSGKRLVKRYVWKELRDPYI